MLRGVVTAEKPLVGIEPSALLAFRDEYPEMAGKELADDARLIAGNAMLFEEFISREIDRGNITQASLLTCRRRYCCTDTASRRQSLHRSDNQDAVTPVNYTVEEINDGCCGMAGAFGYEKEHFDMSMKIGEMILFPSVRAASAETLIAATGTSCRHHISDGTGKKALHPVEVLYDAL